MNDSKIQMPYVNNVINTEVVKQNFEEKGGLYNYDVENENKI